MAYVFLIKLDGFGHATLARFGEYIIHVHIGVSKKGATDENNDRKNMRKQS